jgi:hypothetical protein
MMATGFVYSSYGTWRPTLASKITAHDTSAQQQAVTWVQQHIPHTARTVTEGELWLQLRMYGFSDPEIIWTYKVDTDPAVRASYGDVYGLDYLILDQSTIDQSSSVYPTLHAATEGATTLATFGDDGPDQIKVLKVRKRR